MSQELFQSFTDSAYNLDITNNSLNINNCAYITENNLYNTNVQASSSFQLESYYLDANIDIENIKPPTPTSILTPQIANGTRTVSGTFYADTFTYLAGYDRTIFSGNGNVEYGNGRRDTLNLSEFFSTTVILNYADTLTGGVLYNPGNGTRLFDAIELSNGSEILFEGIDTIKFADITIDLSVKPNDPLFNEQWNLHMMGVHNAWRFTTGSKNVLVGIEDTGLLTSSNGSLHPDLRSTIFVENNYADELSTFPVITHGTLVQGVIAAASNNGIGMSGINWNSDIFHIDTIGSDAGDYGLAVDTLMSATQQKSATSLKSATQTMIDWANSNGGQHLIINLSLTGGYSPGFEQLIANNQNVLFVIASGNSGSNILESPADLAIKYKNVIAGGASWGPKNWYGNQTIPGERIIYNNWWGSNSGLGLTLMAPSEVISTNGTYSKISNTYEFSYENRFNGTSAAAPNITGVASLVWSANNYLTATQVSDILSQTAFDLGTAGKDTNYGNGFVNADAAVRRAIALARTPITKT